MRSLQFISCNAPSTDGGLCFAPSLSTAPSNNLYCYFFFFHDCRCTTTSTPYGHDMFFQDNYNLFSSNNPFYESYTTNTNDKRVCRQYHNGSSWVTQHSEKKDWLKEGMKDRYVGVSGDDSNSLFEMSETTLCNTLGHAVQLSMVQLSSTITVLSGMHVREGETIIVVEKISVVAIVKAVSVIGTNSLSSSSTKLFNVTNQ
ncbi:uncharacterized protein MONOS_6036 [Monocercomonoides exilis]|uniref:uncharacterized protein n=1 Tax=Monocercomonoides exilis TaxID=2049356 RepID=UPI00355A1047|nr:hypothetical protein MONOS_6036 [Monocercomonoides exilis]|eukprot:MONOS_6036.1-p1 / transcript=MONOS_6036.1 / gene=MONOS_6036 / organism=Monocercomonoides_exilis_PA203 / gene_product=unspecified product / transcript_product=unspecified product / location=Mono_scaffold00184:94089-94691(+) / protein_length=201 / sequence_SO=supercontig / SO=protein_coding / is_pseudo=false